MSKVGKTRSGQTRVSRFTDPPFIMSVSFFKIHGQTICQQINKEIPDARDIVSVIHEKTGNDDLMVTVYYCRA